MKIGKQKRLFQAVITQQMKDDLEHFAAQDGVQRGLLFSTSGQLRAEKVCSTAQTTWLFKTTNGKPFNWPA